MLRSNTALAIDELDEEDLMKSLIEVRDKEGFKGVFAKEDIVEDSVIFYLKGTVSTRPSKYTIQLARDQHLTFPLIRNVGDDINYCWQYLNHCCEPNGYMNTAELTFRAARNIRRGEEITFNYLTTESAMAVPFECVCGSGGCFGYIQGHDFLNPAQAKRLSLMAGANNVVTLFMPAVKRVPVGLENSKS